MTRAYCLTCNEQVDVDDDGRCPRGHAVSTDDLGPQPWIGRALSAVGNAPGRAQAAGAGDPEPPDSEPSDPSPSTDEPDELAALLADLDDGGPADLVTEDEPAPTDTASELEALAEELALRADSPESADVGNDDLEDDDLGALDDAISAWDESDGAIVAPSEPVPDDADPIPPPPPADAEPPATAPPPPPPPAPAPPIADLFAEDDAPAPEDDVPAPEDLPPMEEPVDDEPEPEEPVLEAPAEEPASPREIDLTNFTASGKRIDTSSAPRKKGGRFGIGR